MASKAAELLITYFPYMSQLQHEMHVTGRKKREKTRSFVKNICLVGKEDL